MVRPRPITSEEWSRFDFYAQRVRILVLDNFRPGGLYRAWNSFNALYTTRGTRPFPNLRDTVTQFVLEQTRDLQKFFICPAASSVTDLHLIMSPRFVADNLDLETLVSACPSVRHVKFDLSPEVDLAALGSVAARWRTLRSFTIRVSSVHVEHIPVKMMDYRLLHDLRLLPELDHLEISMLTSSNEIYLASREASAGLPFLFPTLRRLRVRSRDVSGDVSIVRSLLTDILSPSLRELDVTASGPSIFATIAPIVRTSPYSHQLVKLCISLFSCPPGPVPLVVVSALDLSPLQHLHALRFFSLKISRPVRRVHIDLSDEDCDNLAASWPLLRNIGIEEDTALRFRGLSVIRTTPKTLVHFAHRCALLNDAALTMSDATFKYADEGSDAPLIHTHLKYLRLQLSDIKNLDGFAAYLAQRFPRLTQITQLIERANCTEEWPWEELMRRVQHCRERGARAAIPV